MEGAKAHFFPETRDGIHMSGGLTTAPKVVRTTDKAVEDPQQWAMVDGVSGGVVNVDLGGAVGTSVASFGAIALMSSGASAASC